MQIILLGTGTPVLDRSRQHSSLLVRIDGENLLFDAGRGATTQMLKAGIQPQQVDAVFITHHHYDHISDLGEFLLTAWHNGRQTPLTVYGPHGTAEIVAALLGQVYARDIAFALFTEKDLVDIRALVQVVEVASGWAHDSGRWQVSAEYVEHGSHLGLSVDVWPCLGYRLELDRSRADRPMVGRKVLAISGDTVACAGLDRLAQNADVLVQCCYLAEAEITTPAREQQAKYVIASSGQVGKIAAQNGVKRLVLTHIRPKTEALMQSLVKDVCKDFTGELIVGEDLMVIDV